MQATVKPDELRQFSYELLKTYPNKPSASNYISGFHVARNPLEVKKWLEMRHDSTQGQIARIIVRDSIPGSTGTIYSFTSDKDLPRVPPVNLPAVVAAHTHKPTVPAATGIEHVQGMLKATVVKPRVKVIS